MIAPSAQPGLRKPSIGLLVRPVPASLQVATQIASLHGLEPMGLGIVVFAMASDRSALKWSAGKALYLLVVFFSSAVMLASINVLVNMIAFWEPSAQSAIPTFIAMTIDFAKHPLDGYTGSSVG